MELLPSISEIFHVSVDSLLGIDDSAEKEKVSQYLERFQTAINGGRIDDCISIARQGVAEYPNNYTLLNKLMYALFVSGDDDGNIPEWRENKEKNDAEIVALGERIMRHCPDQNIRLEAAARLAFQHTEMGRKSLGRSIYDTLPPKELCRENQIWWGLEEDERLSFLRDVIRSDYESLKSNIWLLGTSGCISDNESVAAIEKVFALEELICDGNLPKNSWGETRLHYDMAKLYAKLGQKEQMYQRLEKAAFSSRAFDNRPKVQNYTSLLLGNTEEKAADFETSDTRPLCEIMRDRWLSNTVFDPYRDTEEFKESVVSLSE